MDHNLHTSLFVTFNNCKTRRAHHVDQKMTTLNKYIATMGIAMMTYRYDRFCQL